MNLGNVSKKLVTGVVILSAVALGAPLAAYAGTTYGSYSTTIPKFGGSAYSGNQTKAVSNQTGIVKVSRVGADRAVGVRIQKSDGSDQGKAVYEVTGGSTVPVKNSISKGSKVRLQFWGNVVWPVSVQVSGTWKSN